MTTILAMTVRMAEPLMRKDIIGPELFSQGIPCSSHSLDCRIRSAGLKHHVTSLSTVLRWVLPFDLVRELQIAIGMPTKLATHLSSWDWDGAGL